VSLLLKLRGMLQRRRLETDIDEELRTHIEMRAADNKAAGMPAKEANYAARRSFGNVTLAKEDTRAMDIIGWLDTAMRDVRYAFRLLRKTPGFTAGSVLTLALGVIGTTVLLTAYNAIALRTLSVRDNKSLTVLKRELRAGGSSTEFTEEEYRNFSEHSQTLDAAIAETGYDTLLAQLPNVGQLQFAEPRPVIVKLVSENYFSVLGVKAVAGQMLPDEKHNGAEAVGILSYSSWQRRFRGDLSVLGQSVFLYGTPITIIGIAPRDFIGTGLPPVPPDMWIPLSMETRVEPSHDWVNHPDEARLRVLGRLKPETSARQAAIELTAMAQRFEGSRGMQDVTSAIDADPTAYFLEKRDPHFLAISAMLLLSFGMVLSIACANLANFFLARATARRKEMAVRRALGASRGRLVRQLLTEGVLIGLAAGAITLIISPLLCDFIWNQIQSRIVFRFSDLYIFVLRFSPNAWVIGWTMAVSIGAGMLFSLMGALHGSKDPNRALRGQAPNWPLKGSRLRVSARDLLIAAQVVFSVVLLVNAGLVGRGMARGQKVYPGFDTRQVMDIEFADIEGAGIDKAHTAEFRAELTRQLSGLPGVRGVAFADHVPLLGAGATTVTALGKTEEHAFDSQVSPGFFSVFGIKIVRGRDFTTGDEGRGTSAVIITESTARHLWPGEDALGKTVAVGETKSPVQVIGVVEDTRTVVLGRVEPVYLYFPTAANAPINDVFVRTVGEATASTGLVLNAISAINNRLTALASVHVMDDAIWFQRLPSTIGTLFAACVGGLGIFLAGVGIYGTIVYSVVQRTREIGIRIALGAGGASILRLVLLRMMRLVGVATCVGLGLAGALSHALTILPFGIGSLLLFGVSPWDPLVFVTVAAFLAVTALSAAYRPARRATEVDPMVALRCE
jgi:predicted permease